MGGLAALDTLPVPRHGYPALERLLDTPRPLGNAARGGLIPELRDRYDGDLFIPLDPDRPTIVANFVTSLDGVVAMDRSGRTGGGDVSGFDATDRFTMGILRSFADVVLVGAGTIRPSRAGPLTPRQVYPAAAEVFARQRRSLRLADTPVTLVATRSGDLDAANPLFADPAAPVVVAAPDDAAHRLRRSLPRHVSIEPLGVGGAAAGLVAVASRLGAAVVVCEGGPHLLGSLLRARRIDELFLTLAPQLAGRAAGEDRLSLVEGAALWPDAPWGRLVSVRRAGDHLFLRYELEETEE